MLQTAPSRGDTVRSSRPTSFRPGSSSVTGVCPTLFCIPLQRGHSRAVEAGWVMSFLNVSWSICHVPGSVPGVHGRLLLALPHKQPLCTARQESPSLHLDPVPRSSRSTSERQPLPVVHTLLGLGQQGAPFPWAPHFLEDQRQSRCPGPQLASFRFSWATLAGHSPLLTLTLLCALPRGQPG
ncbi:hypothetical protein HJG60_012117 [Phyllostomus discolor]|uniref:Uncharacterized protein n=1 Tax=Phyllostomus discolor TaxID=89673 RepID=A0A833ZPJ8_9CHIR|nr:hypothetical protein HJG60_012117 [Phyllostomus discolor]